MKYTGPEDIAIARYYGFTASRVSDILASKANSPLSDADKEILKNAITFLHIINSRENKQNNLSHQDIPNKSFLAMDIALPIIHQMNSPSNLSLYEDLNCACIFLEEIKKKGKTFLAETPNQKRGHKTAAHFFNALAHSLLPALMRETQEERL